MNAKEAVSATQKFVEIDAVDAVYSEFTPATIAASSVLKDKNILHLYISAPVSILSENYNIKSFTDYQINCKRLAQYFKEKGIKQAEILDEELFQDLVKKEAKAWKVMMNCSFLDPDLSPISIYTGLFEFEENEIYMELVYDNIKEKCGPKRFMACIKDLLLNKSKEDWNKAYGFKGRMAVKDWLDIVIPAKVVKEYSIKAVGSDFTVKQTYLDYPDDYLAELKNHPDRSELNSEKKQLEGQQATQNKNNMQTYIKQINNNLKSK
jgi:hypothetical protein